MNKAMDYQVIPTCSTTALETSTSTSLHSYSTTYANCYLLVQLQIPVLYCSHFHTKHINIIEQKFEGHQDWPSISTYIIFFNSFRALYQAISQ